MSAAATGATALRVLTQLRRDPRTVALLLFVPALLITLLRFVFDGRQETFDSLGGPMIGLCPFITMFLVTSITMLRERTGGTLERLMSMPVGKLDLLGAPAAKVAETLDLVQLADSADRPVRNLSGGQRARVSLGTALLGDPDVLVLDEPTVGLDPVLREDLWRTFHGLAARGVTLLVSSHVMDEAARCDDLLLMRDGRLLATLTPAELRERTGEEDMERAFLHLIDHEEMSA